ncbi:putative nucleotidyltransferase substrate binding domain-containing protein [Nocardioides euryhalodurans]|uniref:Cyclic nucleotide-binding/CBS domain-containing protein n=1 Tax=Nocardioides euryhalodurans TaxID=2518370 RepID=A0A4P7GPH2_9ACTN|nr:putative nucleotidyltransferase substrate binding domain-containing protein [Nocardioides euryhalodurans]QBR94003.1 cyclic nucleotide-binding/CBS domain-containing protein [Nocardioides euryhalodurans]
MALDVELAEIRDFLAAHAPFDALPAHELSTLPALLEVVYRRRGEVVLPAGEVPEGLLVVRSGAVEARDADGELVQRGGAGTSVGGPALVAGTAQPVTVSAIEDSLLLVLPAAAAGELLARHPALAAALRERGGDRLRGAVEHQRDLHADDLQRAVLRTRVADLVRRPPVTVAATATVREAAEVMHREQVSSVLVTDGERLVGILTDRDLRSRVVAAGTDPAVAVSAVMTPEPVTGSPDAVALEVLLELVRRNLHHLPLLRDGRPVGVVTATDLMRLEQADPVHLVGDVARARDAAEVAEAAGRLAGLVASLVRQGTSARDASRVVTTIGDAVERRLVTLAEDAIGPAPVPYAWVTLGSRARFEQALHADQDHALVLHDDASEADDAWFVELADRVTADLEVVGYPRCGGGTMAGDARWRRTRAGWRDEVSAWVREPTPGAVIGASIFFDLRHLSGEASLTADVADHLRRSAAGADLFLAHLASHAAARPVPVGFFRGLVVERTGEHRDTLDLKRGGIGIVVEIARIHALTVGSPATSTLERLEDAVAGGALSRPLADDLHDAWEYLTALRLGHQADQVRHGALPDNHVDPSALSSLEQRHLRTVFGVLRSAQSALAQRHPVSALW